VPSVADVRDRLPSLYRPPPGDRGLLTQFLRAVVAALDEVNVDAGDVMNAHWLPYADRALFSRYFLADRRERGLPPPSPKSKEDEDELERFPYVHDLARLAAVLPLPPWQELLPPAGDQPAQRESAEAYRQRIRRIVALYRNGLGTTGALRSIVEAQLPVDFELEPERQDRGFAIEEFAPLGTSMLDVQVRGVPADLVGPLMRFEVGNEAIEAAAPTILVDGLEPVEGSIDATESPLLELFDSRVGIGYRGTVPPGRTLRLRPAYSSWLGLDGGLARSQSGPGGDPTAPGPWALAEGGPAGAIVAVLQTRDSSVWAATESELHRLDGGGWTRVADGLPTVRCLAEDGDALLLGTDEGLRRLEQHPEGESAVDEVAGVEDTVHALLADGAAWLVGTAAGLVRLEGAEAAPFELTGTPVRALARDRGGVVYAGTELGLFQRQPGTGHWYWYAGADASDQVPDWQRFLPAAEGEARNFPAAEDVFLSPVRAVHRAPDASLWIGTEAGLARYVARRVRGLAYTTALEAFPDLGVGPVHAIAEDARGLVWIATGRGLLRYDGRDLWEFRSDAGWVQLGRADRLYGDTVAERGSWRFSRASGQWQRLQQAAWVPFTGEPRTAEEQAVRALAWTDEAVGDLLGDGEPEPVDEADLVVRYKPTDTRIVDGGVPAIPRLPAGTSTWRYLALEGDGAPEPEQRPAWTREGRLLPPPPDREAALPGRYDLPAPPLESQFDDAVFAFRPAARVRFEWRARRPLSVLARLRRRAPDEHVEPAVLDRVFQGLDQVRPAGVNAALAVDEEIVRGGTDGPAS
jgi:hypothetical protein